jgi:hypothetical protein
MSRPSHADPPRLGTPRRLLAQVLPPLELELEGELADERPVIPPGDRVGGLRGSYLGSTVDQVLVIGGGADYGDDTWVVLDYRSDPTNPRVVANEWPSGPPPGTAWREVAPSVTDFLRLLGIRFR